MFCPSHIERGVTTPPLPPPTRGSLTKSGSGYTWVFHIAWGGVHYVPLPPRQLRWRGVKSTAVPHESFAFHRRPWPGASTGSHNINHSTGNRHARPPPQRWGWRARWPPPGVGLERVGRRRCSRQRPGGERAGICRPRAQARADPHGEATLSSGPRQIFRLPRPCFFYFFFFRPP